MAELPASYVSVGEVWQYGGPGAKTYTVKRCIVSIPASDNNAYGDSTNTIPASAFGLKNFRRVSNIVQLHVGAAHRIIPAAEVSPNLITFDITDTTDANRDQAVGMLVKTDGATQTGTYLVTVEGVGN